MNKPGLFPPAAQSLVEDRQVSTNWPHSARAFRAWVLTDVAAAEVKEQSAWGPTGTFLQLLPLYLALLWGLLVQAPMQVSVKFSKLRIQAAFTVPRKGLRRFQFGVHCFRDY